MTGLMTSAPGTSNTAGSAVNRVRMAAGSPTTTSLPKGDGQVKGSP